MSALLELAERCEQATGPDYDISQMIGEASCISKTYQGMWDGETSYPNYTSSLDAAMTLVPEGCREWHCGRNIKTGKGQAYLLDPATMRGPMYVHAETPALALCAAALKARAAIADGRRMAETAGLGAEHDQRGGEANRQNTSSPQLPL